MFRPEHASLSFLLGLSLGNSHLRTIQSTNLPTTVLSFDFNPAALPPSPFFFLRSHLSIHPTVNSFHPFRNGLVHTYRRFPYPFSLNLTVAKGRFIFIYRRRERGGLERLSNPPQITWSVRREPGLLPKLTLLIGLLRTALLCLNALQLPAQRPSALGTCPPKALNFLSEQPRWVQLASMDRSLKKAYAC